MISVSTIVNPTDKWTATDRRIVAQAIKAKVAKRHVTNEQLNPNEVWDVIERLGYLVYEPSSFLEDNRAAILGGKDY